MQEWLRPYAESLVSYVPAAVVTSTYRSFTEQLRLWNNRAHNPYPVAPPGSSYHQLGRAFDVAAPISDLQWMGAVWKYWGGTWSDKDPIHFQA